MAKIKAASKKGNVKLPLHKFVATGGDTRKYRGSRAINNKTINNVNK